jgi:tRNA1Val (adenine37-N6)-methyltransferase
MNADYLQPEGGYRFTQDSILLAGFAPPSLFGQAADLGAGSGVVGLEALTLGRLKGLERLYFVEASELYKNSLEENIKRHKILHQEAAEFHQIWNDWRNLSREHFNGPLDLIMVNPPYFPIGSSGLSTEGRHKARHEELGDVRELFAAAYGLLRSGGHLLLSWPRRRLSTMIDAARANGLTPLRLHFPPRLSCSLVLAELERD